MKLRHLPGWFRDTALRMLPHRGPTGLVRIGDPGPDSPVLLTGNFTLTVRRLAETLAGHDVWLLCANSNGINVWCAAGGGHLTHHDVISVLRTSGIAEQVHHRRLILPQLGATGIERRVIEEATGWETRWGPARLEDLPACLARGGGVHKGDRKMRFPLWERLEMAMMWAIPSTVIGAPIFALLGGWRVGAVAAIEVALATGGIFVALPVLPVQGRWRWLTLGATALLTAGAAAGLLTLAASASVAHIVLTSIAAVAICGILAVDLAGTTPWYGSYINLHNNNATIELVADACTGAADCVQVCPRDVLAMNGKLRKVEIARPDQCIQCGACIVQCPEDALRFRYDDGRVVEAPTIRRTRMNMVGRRTVEVADTPRK